MTIRVVEAEESSLPAIRRFSEAVWQRPRSDAYYRWRYETSRPFHRAWLAMKDGECLAMETAIQRPWRMGDERIDVLEVFDWYVRPELRNSGLGVRVMQALMKEPTPLMLVGGSEDTLALLPRLKWTEVAASRRFTLSLGAARAREALARRGLPRPAAALGAAAMVRLPGIRPRPRAVPRGGVTLAVSRVGPEIQALYEGDVGYGTVPRWTPALLDWLLAGFPGTGHFLPLYFQVGERLVGWSLTRILPTALGCDAEILEVFTPQPDADLYAWMISETAVRVAGHRPGVVSGQSSCPAIAEAYRRNRFAETGRNPVNFWLGGRPAPPEPIVVGSNTNDAAITPMTERWWDAGLERNG